jgi:hypothetical protein
MVISRLVDIWMAFPPVLFRHPADRRAGAPACLDHHRHRRHRLDALCPRGAGRGDGAGRDGLCRLGPVAGRGRIGTMLREILPNVLPTIVVLLTLEMGIAVIVEAILSFVNLSISTDDPTWGGMIAEGRTSISSGLVGAGVPAGRAVPDRPVLQPTGRRAEGPFRSGAAMSLPVDPQPVGAAAQGTASALRARVA